MASLRSNFDILITAVLLVSSFLSVSFISEYLTREPFTAEKIKFTGTSSLVLAQALFSACAGLILMKVFHEEYSGHFPKKEFILLSQTYCGAMFFSNKALLYIDYPTHLITKLFKPVTVLLFTIFFTKKYTMRQIVFSSITFFGVFLFTSEKIFNLKKTDTEYTSASYFFGLFLILMSLLADGIASSEEDIVTHTYHVPTFRVMAYSNLFAVPTFLVISLVTGDLAQVFYFIRNDFEFSLIILCFVTCSVLGQFLIYRLIHLANTLLLTAVTNTRKIVTMVISVLFFHHPISMIQIIAACIVFGSLFADIMTRKPHNKEKEITDEKKEN
ncbi:UDP-galactose transporter, putative [Entamoeba invadens IP1]|uniref:UDP-galactose transporter, putative n=1 Tax=Entamoeba invadens IP1 TaxID=370355 RepID=A0A0A1UEW1_ENTIV|nr:UDP-galactose transporter, putative [Entamoeba invadens IP1]ELP95136.1 UDP-galactose transporter, putative [Entamoeba invadens IP1]|eukprot:XP_004261907.1 UDP-galactose transporter, putative [Entamoeba invadens IP1]